MSRYVGGKSRNSRTASSLGRSSVSCLLRHLKIAKFIPNGESHLAAVVLVWCSAKTKFGARDTSLYLSSGP